VADLIDVCEDPDDCPRIGARHARVSGHWRHQVLVDGASAAKIIERNQRLVGTGLAEVSDAPR
jgi:hypothetical protein